MIIQALIYPNFTTLDLIGALQPLSQIPNAIVEIVAKNEGPIPTDCGADIVAKYSFKTASTTPNVILVPGGGSAAIEAIEDKDTIDFLAAQGKNADWVVAVCTGTLLLGQAGLIKGYKAASHWSVMEYLEKFGAITTYDRVVIDRNRCTGGGVTAGVDIGLTLTGLLANDQVGKMLELVYEYNPQPPFKTGYPTLADEATLKAASERAKNAFSRDRIIKATESSAYL